LEINPSRLEEVENRLENGPPVKYGPTVEEILFLRRGLTRAAESFSLMRRDFQLRQPGEPSSAMMASGETVEGEKEGGFGIETVDRRNWVSGHEATTFEIRIDSGPSRRAGSAEFDLSQYREKQLRQKSLQGTFTNHALKRILGLGRGSRSDLDEVDSGTGGDCGGGGRKLKSLPKHQVICRPTSPDLFATHYSVKKDVRGGRTLTRVDRLDREARVDEIARMLGGVKVTEKTRAHAEEMIENAKKGDS
jgi:hypothetical protein